MQLRLGFLSILGMAMLLTPVSAIASDNAQPYKATTVDECIQEKECVWYAFSKQLGISDYTRWVISGKSLHKWDKAVRFSAIGNAKKYLGHLAQNAIIPLKDVFPYGITADKPPVFLMVFTDNKEASLLEWQNKLSQRQLGQTRSKIKFNKMNNINEGCYSISMSHVGSSDISTVLTIVDTNSSKAEYCMITHFYSGFGFWGYDAKQPFSFLSGKTSSETQFTKLDKFMLFLLYQPEFKSGQQAKDIKKVFENIYPKTKEKFLEKFNDQ